METVPKTLTDAIKYYADPDNALRYLMSLRWPDGIVICPYCDSRPCMFLKTRRIFKCKACRKQFSIKVGSIFEDSPISLEKWLAAIWLLANCKNGVSSYEISRDIKVTQKSTWFMLHRIRLAMQDENAPKLAGVIEADETLVGGKAKNMHLDKLTRLRMKGGLHGGGMEGKAIVMGLLERHTRQARVKVLPKTRQFHVRRNVIANVEKGATVYSDSLRSYANLPTDGFVHDFVDHSEAYVRGHVHTNGLENFWSLFKRTLKGTYVSVEPYHLQAYADEQCFRFNERKTDDAARFERVCRQIVGRRITWKQLTGKETTKEPVCA
ncbi:MAG: IS1595 family transposase [Bryobacteraceae bacterium]